MCVASAEKGHEGPSKCSGSITLLVRSFVGNLAPPMVCRWITALCIEVVGRPEMKHQARLRACCDAPFRRHSVLVSSIISLSRLSVRIAWSDAFKRETCAQVGHVAADSRSPFFLTIVIRPPPCSSYSRATSAVFSHSMSICATCDVAVFFMFCHPQTAVYMRIPHGSECQIQRFCFRHYSCVV